MNLFYISKYFANQNKYNQENRQKQIVYFDIIFVFCGRRIFSGQILINIMST
jgi:hypothetical protein